MTHYYRLLLHQCRYINVATITKTKDGEIEPHCSILFFHVADGKIYWTSRRGARHSKNILENPSVFITLFEENVKEGTGSGKGLYLKGQVHVLTDAKEVEAAKILSTEKANRDRRPWEELQVQPASDFLNDSIRAVYCFTPEEAWTNTWHRSVGDERVSLDLELVFLGKEK